MEFKKSALEKIILDHNSVNVNPIVKEDCLRIIKDNSFLLNKLSGKNILITGGNGFLMSYLVDVLAYWNLLNKNKKCQIFVLDSSKKFDRIFYLKKRKDIKFINTDVAKVSNLKIKFNYIVHGASIASPTYYRIFPLKPLDANILGSRKILDLAKNNKVSSMIFASSSEVYGNPDKKNIPTSENYNGDVSFTGPRACYDESKRVGETLCNIYIRNYKLPVKIIRPFNVYGPNQNINDKRIIPDLLKSALKNNNLELYSKGLDTRSFCYVSDAISLIIKILLNKQNKEVAFNVGNDEREISIKNLSKIFVKISNQVLNKKIKVIFKTSKDKDYMTDNPQRRKPSLKLAKKFFNWKPKIKLKIGLKRTLESYLK